MMHWQLWPYLQFVFQIIYSLCALYVAIYGAQAAWLGFLYLRNYYTVKPRTNSAITEIADEIVDASLYDPQDYPIDHPIDHPSDYTSDYPVVTIQLPIYNEHHVVERLIDACVNQDYPAHLLQVQILDDSGDETTLLAETRAEEWRRKGRDVTVVRRLHRVGYKAGALDYALPMARGELIAIFDADFLPPSDFLRNVIPCFLRVGMEDVGFVQTRWEHLNRAYSMLTECQALALDAHFGIEQPMRAQHGFLFGFNGSAGIWRRECIEDPAVGGWQHDTLCEDLDLSYRAQLCGWQGIFLENVSAPAEVPPQLAAFKRQQARWAKGSIQTLCKLVQPVWKSEKKLFIRIVALLHLSNYLLHPALLIMLLLTVPFLLTGTHTSAILAPLSITSLFTPWLYFLAQRKLHPTRWRQHILYLPVLAVLGMGLSLNNSIAVWQALTGKQKEFLRTPKFRVEKMSDQWQQSEYRLPLDYQLLIEVGLFFYSLFAVVVAVMVNNFTTAFFMLLYGCGFGLTIAMEIEQAWSVRKRIAAKIFPTSVPMRKDHMPVDSLVDRITN